MFPYRFNGLVVIRKKNNSKYDFKIKHTDTEQAFRNKRIRQEKAQGWIKQGAREEAKSVHLNWCTFLAAFLNFPW